MAKECFICTVGRGNDELAGAHNHARTGNKPNALLRDTDEAQPSTSLRHARSQGLSDVSNPPSDVAVMTRLGRSATGEQTVTKRVCYPGQCPCPVEVSS